jgi:transposase
MLRMDQVHVIRHKVLVEGQSIRRVARDMDVSRNTVRKYLKVSEPVRVETKPRARPVLERVAPRIDELLESWGPRTTAKQRITGSRIHRQLVEEGYGVGVTTVRGYLREKRRQRAEVYIPLVHRPGEEGQVDFFDVTVEEDGVFRKAWKFVIRLMYSGRDFAWLYDSCDQLSFLDGHVRAFEHVGGVPQRTIYDNLSAAVRRRVGVGKDRLTDRFRALASHYLFEPCFARPGEGHDKGGVEGRGKGIRLQHLTPIPRGQTLREIAEALLEAIDQQAAHRASRDEAVRERFREETERLRPLPEHAFDPRRVEVVSISRKSLVQIASSTYSVPEHWHSLQATAHVGVEDISITCRGEEVMVARQRKGREIRYRHYLRQLSRKPQAVRQVAPELIAELGGPFGKLWQALATTHGDRESARVLAKILAAVVDHGEEAVAEALEAALSSGRQDLLALAHRVHGESVKTVPVPQALAAFVVESGRAEDYDVLLAGGDR